MLKKLALALLLFLPLSLAAQFPVYMSFGLPAYGLAGTIMGPDGKLFNGTLSVVLARPTAANLCTTPVSIVTRTPAIFNVVSGVIVGGDSAFFVSNSCLKPSVPYFAEMFDTKNVRVYADNWYFPFMNVANVNVGSLSDVGFGAVLSGAGGGPSTTGTQSTSTPIVVAIPSAIVSNPSGQQVITQPAGTSLIVNNFTVTGTFSSATAIAASITGNAATATALAATPAQCASGFYSQGITALGNAICSNAFPANTSFSSLQITGVVRTYTSQGTYMNWNVSTGGPGNGDSDFINVKGAGTGGFNFYTISDGGTPTAPTVVFDSTGNVFAGSFNGILNGNVLGNASTATALASTPAQCASGYAAGISSNGDANCLPWAGTSRVCGANGCYQVDSDGTIEQWGNSADLGGGSLFVNFPLVFPHACQTVIATTVSNTDRITYLVAASGAVPCSNTGFTVASNGSSSSASWIAKGY